MLQRLRNSFRIRVACYSILVLGLFLLGLPLQYTEIKHENDPSPLCGASPYRDGGTGSYWEYFTVIAQYEWQINPLPEVADYVKYDIDPQGINCTSLYLRIKMKNESWGALVEVNATIDVDNTNVVITSIPLIYNASRTEYVTIFDLGPYWGETGYLQIRITFHHHLGGGATWNYFYPYSYPHFYYTSTFVPYGGIFAAIGIICSIFLELSIRIIWPLKEENRKNQELLRLLQQQNRVAYEQALLQLQQDHKELIKMIRYKEEE